MEMNWLEIVVLVLIGLATVGFVVVQVLRATGKVSEEDAEVTEDWIAKWVRIGVHAAEQIFGPGTGEKKLEYVTELLVLLGIDVKEPERAMIEAEVFSLKQKTEEV